jgi:hypothetical protein
MRRLLIIIILSFLAMQIETSGEQTVGSQLKTNELFESDDVHIGPNAIGVPLGRIILIRKGAEYGAVKFTDFWFGKTVHHWYGKYESYYQGDGTGDFSKKNVLSRKGDVSTLPPIGWGGLHCTLDNPNLRCGPFKLAWSPKSTVYFFYFGQGGQRDYGIELAPTKWAVISQVNVFDPRLEWYRYDEMRLHWNIPIDQLWEDREEKK